MDEIKDRLKQYYGISTDVELAEKLGVNLNTLKTWSKRDRIPYDKLHKVVQNETLSFDWLLTGKGEMFKSTSKALVTQDDELTHIPEYDVCLSAGFGAYPDDHALAIGYRPFSTVWLNKKGLKAEDLQLVRVAGDSMEPLLKDKDIIMLDTSKTKPSEAMPFAVRLDDELLVKTIQKQGGGSIALISRNKAYESIIIDQHNPPQDFQVIGAVVWHAHSWI